uniref:Vint domain-containing protein n=1 Tax=viral metagenome TaxID=1070528 RepID=A0A6C0H6L3_9ZZZZ
MPTGKQWTMFIFVNIAFIIQFALMYYFIGLSEIKKNWNEYRCNPMYMPLSDDIQSDFTYCIQNTQVNLMGYILQPITYITSSLSSLGSDLTNNINGIRTMLGTIRSFITTIIENVFGVFLNLVIEMQKITISIKDTIGKMIGIMVSLLYILDGSNKTIVSMWAGPSGQMVRALGHCFYPNTLIKMNNGIIKKIDEIKIGDYLEENNKVIGTMKILPENELLMELDGIFVTGSHFIKYENKWIMVNEHPQSKIQNKIKSDYYICLITENHSIKIGKYLFYDWEDWRINDTK